MDGQINPKEIYDTISSFKNSPGPQFEENEGLEYNHFTSPEEVIIDTQSNQYLQEQQSKYPLYHFTIGGKGDAKPNNPGPEQVLKPVSEQVSTFEVVAPVKKYTQPNDDELPLEKKSDDYEEEIWRPEVVTPPSRPAKVFQYDYTIGEDVTLPFRREATTESMFKIFESVTPAWTTPEPTTSTTTTTTTTTTEASNYGPKRIKKLST